MVRDEVTSKSYCSILSFFSIHLIAISINLSFYRNHHSTVDIEGKVDKRLTFFMLNFTKSRRNPFFSLAYTSHRRLKLFAEPVFNNNYICGIREYKLEMLFWVTNRESKHSLCQQMHRCRGSRKSIK